MKGIHKDAQKEKGNAEKDIKKKNWVLSQE
jgi:hypothetical protein